MNKLMKKSNYCFSFQEEEEKVYIYIYLIKADFLLFERDKCTQHLLVGKIYKRDLAD